MAQLTGWRLVAAAYHRRYGPFTEPELSEEQRTALRLAALRKKYVTLRVTE